MQKTESYIIVDRSLSLEPYYDDIEKIYVSNGWGTHYSRATLYRMFEHCHYWVALKGNSAVGLIRAFSDSISVSHLSEILVEKTHQGLGVGDALMKVLIKNLGHTTIYADVLGTQSPILFQKFGLQEKTKFTVFARRALSESR